LSGNGIIGLAVSDTSNNSLNHPNLGSSFLQYVGPREQNGLMLNELMAMLETFLIVPVPVMGF
jgi:hypothetical protein